MCATFVALRGGSIGCRIDGPANHNLNLNVGTIFAKGANSRALYPVGMFDNTVDGNGDPNSLDTNSR